MYEYLFDIRIKEKLADKVKNISLVFVVSFVMEEL